IIVSVTYNIYFNNDISIEVSCTFSFNDNVLFVASVKTTTEIQASVGISANASIESSLSNVIHLCAAISIRACIAILVIYSFKIEVSIIDGIIRINVNDTLHCSSKSSSWEYATPDMKSHGGRPSMNRITATKHTVVPKNSETTTQIPTRTILDEGDTKSSNGSNSLVPGVAVGSFVAGAVVTLLICLLVVFVKRRKKRKSHVSDLPLTVREQPSGEPQVENQENFSNGRPPKDKGPFLLRKA
ncbi:unnamed protein product, partial [Porites evermanni]